MKRTVAALLMIATPVAYAADSALTSSGPADTVPIEIYTEPVAKHIAAPNCMGLNRLPVCNEIIAGFEGWVYLNFMVDSSGKPYEVTVASSSGNKDFEQSARKAVEASTFAPGTVNGRSVESDSEFKFTFGGIPPSTGASDAFISGYKSLMKAIDAKDRAKADAARKEVKVQNLYESAYFGMATYLYQRQWGNDEQQLAGLTQAIAEENNARYLSKDLFQSALRASLQLQVRLRLYAEALQTVAKLRKQRLDDKTAGELTSLTDQLKTLRDDGRRYELQGEMPAGSWGINLFKRHFHAVVSEGYISQVKLRCQKRFVSFAFDPELEYQVASKDGNCYMEFIGAPGTKFSLAQF